MALVIPWPSVRQALIRQLRANLVLKDQLLGDWAEGFAPPETAYPRGILQLHYAPALLDWTGVVNILGVDVLIFAKTQEDAASAFQLAFTTLNQQRLTVTGQTSLSCLFTSSLSLQDEDPQGKPIYEVGGVLEVKVAQSNPALRSLIFTADSDIA